MEESQDIYLEKEAEDGRAWGSFLSSVLGYPSSTGPCPVSGGLRAISAPLLLDFGGPARHVPCVLTRERPEPAMKMVSEHGIQRFLSPALE